MPSVNAQTGELTSVLTYGSITMMIASPRIKAFEFSPHFQDLIL